MGRIILSKEPEKECDAIIQLENGLYTNLYMNGDTTTMPVVLEDTLKYYDLGWDLYEIGIISSEGEFSKSFIDNEKCNKLIRKNFNYIVNEYLKRKSPNLNQMNANFNDIKHVFAKLEDDYEKDISQLYISLFGEELIKEAFRFSDEEIFLLNKAKEHENMED